jgi:uncharacterized iron-regulated membrane protein
MSQPPDEIGTLALAALVLVGAFMVRPMRDRIVGAWVAARARGKRRWRRRHAGIRQGGL